MSCVTVKSVRVIQNPAKFTDPLEFELSFESIAELKEDLEWKIIYVGSAGSTAHDQELESVLVGPVQVGVNKFIFKTNPPDPSKIPKDEIIGVTVILVKCSYKDQEFVRIGFFVNNELPEGEETPETFTEQDYSRIARNILTSKPRVTSYAVSWD